MRAHHQGQNVQNNPRVEQRNDRAVSKGKNDTPDKLLSESPRVVSVMASVTVVFRTLPVHALPTLNPP